MVILVLKKKISWIVSLSQAKVHAHLWKKKNKNKTKIPFIQNNETTNNVDTMLLFKVDWSLMINRLSSSFSKNDFFSVLRSEY